MNHPCSKNCQDLRCFIWTSMTRSRRPKSWIRCGHIKVITAKMSTRSCEGETSAIDDELLDDIPGLPTGQLFVAHAMGSMFLNLFGYAPGLRSSYMCWPRYRKVCGQSAIYARLNQKKQIFMLIRVQIKKCYLSLFHAPGCMMNRGMFPLDA